MRTVIDPNLVDWSDCDLVERNPLKLSGIPILKHARVQADSIVENYESGSPVEEISENFSISEEILRERLEWAAPQRNFSLSRPIICKDWKPTCGKLPFAATRHKPA